jgi:hypothetical protein
MDASDTLRETPRLQLLAFRHAYELTMRWTDTQKGAARALKWLSVSGEDDKLGEYQEKLVQNYQRVYARARGTLKTRAGNEYVDVAVSLGDQMTKVEKYDLAFKRYADAVRMARLVKHQDLAVFHARLNWVKQKEKTQARVKELEKEVLDGSEVGRAKAALELVDLYAGELNKVKEAAEMARLTGDDKLAALLANAMKPAEKLSGAESIELGTWFKDLGSRSSFEGKHNAYGKARDYFRVASEFPKLTNLEKLKAMAGTKQVEAAKKLLPPLPSFSGSGMATGSYEQPKYNIKPVKTAYAGWFSGGEEFNDVAAKGDYLVGFRIAFKPNRENSLGGIQPIYRSRVGRKTGKEYGTGGNATTVMAKPGYAVGSVFFRGTFRIEGIGITFMKINGEELDVMDSYKSKFYGHGGGREKTLGGDGRMIMGVWGHQEKGIKRMGLVMVEREPVGSNEKVKGLAPHQFLGDGGKADHKHRFVELAPGGGPLVGFRIWLRDGKHIEALQGVYQKPVGRTRVTGKRQGNIHRGKMVEFTAKQGYAIGALNVRSGAWVDALQMVFMRINGRKLDSNDQYKSLVIGNDGGGFRAPIKTDGRWIIGVHGIAERDVVSKLGLIIAAKE